jgi:nucleotide-binding universal stress UspA family protein
MYKRILVATDGSPLSQKAADAAVELAAAIGAEMVAIKVVPDYPVSYFEGAVSLSPEDIARTEKSWTDKAQEIVDRLRADAAAAGVKARGVIVHSDLVAESVLAAARKYECDLIVMASHGHKGIKRVLLGSETQHVLTHSDVPVLVLR